MKQVTFTPHRASHEVVPEADEQGNYPAVAYARASLARKIIRGRVAAGLTQRELAELASIRVETLCRIETGKHIPSVPTVDKIDRALKQTARQKRPIKRTKRATKRR
jgi:DNA-binding XRE family transcriptional regulator